MERGRSVTLLLYNSLSVALCENDKEEDEGKEAEAEQTREEGGDR